MLSLLFLGTGGGRFATIAQIRGTGGLYLRSESARIHIDPGPGSLIKLREAGIDPTKTDAIIVTHCHPDHYTDAEVLVEAMTHGCKKRRGLLAGSVSVLSGHEMLGPAISKYHASKPMDVRTLVPEQEFTVDGLRVTPTRAAHSDPTAVGLRIASQEGVISMTGDTALREDIFKQHMNSDALILSVTRPLQSRIPHHLSTEDAASMVAAVRPKLAIMTHFGMKFVGAVPDVQANWIEKQTGIKTVAAWDGMCLLLRNGMPSIQKAASKEMTDPKKISVDLDDIISGE